VSLARRTSPLTLPLVTASLLVVALLLAACAGDDAASAARSGDDPAPTAAETTTSAVTTTTRGPTGSGETVTIAFAGDTNFQNQLGLLRSDPGAVLSPIAATLSAADVTMINLEAALGTGGSKQPKSFTFQVPEQALDALRAAGVDVVTMANNHGMDYGAEGLADSLRIKREGGLPILGIGGDDVEAYEPWVTEVKGQRIGFLAANDVFDNPLRSAWTAGPGHPGLASVEEAHQARFANEVRALRPEVDTLVVFLHWGTERQVCPNQRQKELARLLIDAGADIVVGTHPHRLQAVGFDGQQLVAYSLGNFAFQANSPEGAATGVLTVSATGRRIDGYTWTPAVIRNSVPHPLTGAAAAAAQATMAERQACAGLTPTPVPPTGTAG
jgi:poly-gamma-glutamate capsule biosynthesis protein CapA/YwtB (metallophosphatase superfamily)